MLKYQKYGRQRDKKREGKKRNHNNQTNQKLNVKKNGNKTKLKSNVNKTENNEKAGFKYYYFGACEEREEGYMGENWGQKYVQNKLLKERVVVDWLLGGLGFSSLCSLFVQKSACSPVSLSVHTCYPSKLLPGLKFKYSKTTSFSQFSIL